MWKYLEPDFIVEYIFIEKADEQIKPINDDQGYQMGFFNVFNSRDLKNDNRDAFKSQILNELNYCVKTYDHFKSEEIKLGDYKFGLVDNDQNISEFDVIDENFFQFLLASLRNLMIVGKNFSYENFKLHHIFNYCFDNYTNKT